ncbi:MAG: hypothetical protein MUD01_19625 [Chloroflexaceae bacterium]|jgi:hypothetical protein|nr:hypothetical protein [Chloroflexaceae bacterium]
MARQQRLRRMTIGANRYLWRIQRLDAHYVMLRVWAESRPRRLFPLEVRLRYDDPWVNYGPIITIPPERWQELFQLEPVTPRMVREIIEAALAMEWAPCSH